MNLAERLQHAMLFGPNAPMKAIELAAASGMTRGAISLILGGTTKTLKSQNATKLAGALAVNVLWLVDESGSMLAETFGTKDHSQPYGAKAVEASRRPRGKIEGELRSEDPEVLHQLTKAQKELVRAVSLLAGRLSDSEAKSFANLITISAGRNVEPASKALKQRAASK